MHSWRFVSTVLGHLVLVCAASGSVRLAAQSPLTKPALTETVETRRIQFEVRVSQDGTAVRGLTAQDFDIELGGKPLKSFTVDDMCGDASAPVPGKSRGSSVFYFDDPELTMEGRRRAIEVARAMGATLIARGFDILVLRNADSLRVETTWTHDVGELSASLDRIASDPGNQDYLRNPADEAQIERVIDRAMSLYRETETQRMMADRLAETNPFCGKDAWRKQQTALERAAADTMVATAIAELATLTNDDLRRIGRDLARLAEAVRLLSGRGAPKSLVYFADTLRSDPGGALVRSLDDSTIRRADKAGDSRALARIGTWNAMGAMQAVVQDASSFGVRFYAVEGRGLTTESASGWIRASQDTLVSLALDTGGLSFVNGVAAPLIADRVAADQSCWYLVSFDPTGWDEDRALGLRVYPKRQGTRVNTVSSLVIPSPETLTEARLIAAHFGERDRADRPLSVAIYPVGGTTRQFQVMAQVRLPKDLEHQMQDATWDVGFQVVSRGAVVSHTSNRVAWRGNGPPPIYQTTLSLPAGPYEIIAVARNLGTDAIHQGRFRGTWPDVSGNRVSLSLPSLAQPHRAGRVVVDGEVNSQGVVVRGTGDSVDPREPVGLVTAVCITGTEHVALRAERSIVGTTEIPFASQELTADSGRCVQIRDMVPAGSFGAGRLTYVVRILSGDDTITSQELSFDVGDPTGGTAPTFAAVPN